MTLARAMDSVSSGESSALAEHQEIKCLRRSSEAEKPAGDAEISNLANRMNFGNLVLRIRTLVVTLTMKRKNWTTTTKKSRS